MNHLFLWHPKNGDLRFARNMFIKGFNAWRIPVEDFYNKTGNVTDIEARQEVTARLMYDFYLQLKTVGFKFFIVDAGWGLGEYDGNYFYEKIYNQFEACDDILFDWGECYEDYVETKKMTINQYRRVAEQRINLMAGRLSIGATARNKDKLGANSLTSYLCQEKYWRETDNLIWIFGQYAYHNLLGSLNYEKKAEQIRKLGIKVIGLYQGNPSEWSSVGWENKIFDILGKREKFEEDKREKFIKYFRS